MRYDENGIFIGFDDDENVLEHYGTPRHSGRYPWGSGDNPYQRNENFLARVQKLKNEKDADGKPVFTEVQIAKSMGMNTTEIRTRIGIAEAENKAYLYSESKRLRDKGMSRSAVARRMGVPESTIRSWEKESTQRTMRRYEENAKFLEDRVKEVKYVQVGAGNEHYINNCSPDALKKSLKVLKDRGYEIHNIKIQQLGTGNMTTIPVLTMPGTTIKDVYDHKDQIRMPVDIYMQDGVMKKARDYVSVDPKRVQVVYNEQGGVDKDGLIEVRRGVPDLDLGKNHYVQGRILVDGDHYLKGMITYGDNMPPGIDIRFNTNKHEGTPLFKRGEGVRESVLKPIKANQDNIFGANIKPDDKLIRAHRTYIDENGEEKQSAINIVKEEGDVDKWAKNLASQFASKQPSALAKNQLKILYDNSKAEMEELAAYTNPVVVSKMLEDFAGRCESDAVRLEAAALPRQKTKFIMPLTNVTEHEAYLPGFNDGEQVALVRYPHASITEIPIVTVNNNNKEAKKILGDAIDAIGISPKTAERLSGADFDGDTVLVLPTDKVKIINKAQYPGLIGFSTQDAFPGYDGMKKMTPHQKGVEMGVASNLITDMTIKGAKPEELERAIKYSMVVIDAEKHGLNWRLAEEQLGIDSLKEKYQRKDGRFDVRASTLLSRSTSDDRSVKERKLKPYYQMNDEEKERWKNGEDIYIETGRKIRDLSKTYPRRLMTKEEKLIADGNDKDAIRELHKKMWDDGRAQDIQKDAHEKPIKMGRIYDPYSLTSTGDPKTAQPIEVVYADHMYRMKDLAREARKIARNQPKFERDPEAAKEYAKEVESLKAKIVKAEQNAPLEKQAQILANVKYDSWYYDHPDADKDQQKRQRGIILDEARSIVGAKKLQIGAEDNRDDINPLTPREWQAIQAHAVSENVLKKILSNADMKTIKKYAMPKTKTGLAPAKLSRAKAMLARGYTRKEICEQLDISEHTLIDAIGLANI